MKVINNPSVLDVEQALNLIDNIILLLEPKVIQQDFIDPLTINARYYVVIHNIFLPIMIKELESSIPKVYLTPLSSVYIHDQKIYAIFKTGHRIEYLSSYPDKIRVPIIDLTSDEKLLALASASIAYKMLLTPNEQNILRIIPNNVKTYIEIAFTILEKINWQKGLKINTKGSRPLNIVELVLWINNIVSNTNDVDIIEVNYLRGVMTRIFRIIYRDHEIDLKAISTSTQKFLSKILILLPTNVLIDIINNIKNAYKILYTYRVICS